MKILIKSNGLAFCIYDEKIELHSLGQLTVRRASYVEPTADGKWMVDLFPTGGPSIGPFHLRSEALVAEIRWLEANLPLHFPVT